jgi:hypothetical protein
LTAGVVGATAVVRAASSATGFGPPGVALSDGPFVCTAAGAAAAAAAGVVGCGGTGRGSGAFASGGTFGSAVATPSGRGGAGSVTPVAALERGAGAAVGVAGPGSTDVAGPEVMGGVGVGGVVAAAVPAG